MIQQLFKDCKTYSSYSNATIGLNLYTIPNIDNFAIIDSPGDTENDDYLELFAKKGYAYSKLLIYVMDERKELDADSMKNNKKLQSLVRLRLDYKIPLLIVLTHFDNYCDEIKKTESNWKDTCFETLEKNKDNLLEFINKNLIKEVEQDSKFNGDDIIHTVLVEPKQITDNDIIATLKEDIKNDYNNADEKGKEKILRYIKSGMNLKDNEVQVFLKEMNIYGPKEMIGKLKEIFPYQYHNTFNPIN